jgi:putative transposase
MGCIIPVYCFMPDHLHVLLQGISPKADLWSAMVRFKQRTGFWLKRNRPAVRWQKDFHDRVVRREDNLADHVRYIVNNPVRAGIARDWREYPHIGTQDFDLERAISAA